MSNSLKEAFLNLASSLGHCQENSRSIVDVLKRGCSDLAENSEGGGGGGSSSYSTTEHVIGKWIDGSNLYEKTFTSLSIRLIDDWINAIDISQMGVNECISASGWDDGTYQIALNTKKDSGYIQVYTPGMAGVTLTKISIVYTKIA